LQSSFQVTDAAAFAEFSGYMLNAESFVWNLKGKLNVKALGHTVKDLDLNKDITVTGTRLFPSSCLSSVVVAQHLHLHSNVQA